MSIAPYTPDNQEAVRKLHRLLVRLFDADDFQRHFISKFGTSAPPVPGVSLAELAYRFAAEMARKKKLDSEFFDYIRSLRPDYSREIADAEQMFASPSLPGGPRRDLPEYFDDIEVMQEVAHRLQRSLYELRTRPLRRWLTGSALSFVSLLVLWLGYHVLGKVNILATMNVADIIFIVALSASLLVFAASYFLYMEVRNTTNRNTLLGSWRLLRRLTHHLSQALASGAVSRSDTLMVETALGEAEAVLHDVEDYIERRLTFPGFLQNFAATLSQVAGLR